MLQDFQKLVTFLSNTIPHEGSIMENTQAQTENRNAFLFGFTPQAEIWNGRLAMIGFMAVLLTELLSNKGILHFWGIL
jgi:Chlorophyll A-B binding protein